ncbi:MAG: 3-deoxy-D-manno-octulosonic acid transferase [Thermodesulfobacteriota bacterium]
MNPSLALYNLAACAVAGVALPAARLGLGLAGRWQEIGPRLGLYRQAAPPGPGPRVWLQAVSVGEVGVAAAVAAELMRLLPNVDLTVSATTPLGLAKARESLGLTARIAPFPLDLPWPVLAAAAKLKPQVFACLETEIWPNLLWWLQRRGAGLLLLNGRLSPRSFPRYQKVKSLIAPALGRFSALSMIGPADAERAIALGAPPARVRVDGNAKYAGLMEKARPELTAEPAARLALDGAPLLVAGSVRTGEEAPLLEAFARALAAHPGAVLAVAPRHIERAPRWLAEAGRRGLNPVAWTSLGPARPRPPGCRVVVVDVMGQLMGCYGLARAAFLGASLVRLGGQNPMEPAAWGLPMAYGPSMEDFADAAQALEAAGAGQRVKDAADLAEFWIDCLERPQAAQAAGLAGRRVVAGWSGAARVAALLIVRELERVGALGK